jgi:hypothetical protein
LEVKYEITVKQLAEAIMGREEMEKQEQLNAGQKAEIIAELQKQNQTFLSQLQNMKSSKDSL